MYLDPSIGLLMNAILNVSLLHKISLKYHFVVVIGQNMKKFKKHENSLPGIA